MRCFGVKGEGVFSSCAALPTELCASTVGLVFFRASLFTRPNAAVNSFSHRDEGFDSRFLPRDPWVAFPLKDLRDPYPFPSPLLSRIIYSHPFLIGVETPFRDANVVPSLPNIHMFGHLSPSRLPPALDVFEQNIASQIT